LEYGGWDERWAKNEDSEMAARFLARGERLVCVPAMAARYSPRDTLAGLWTQYRDYGRYRTRTARRHPDSLRASLVLPPALVLTGVCALIAPARPRAAARVGVGVYGTALAAAALRSRARAQSPGEAATVALTLAVMHVSFGVGALQESAHGGPPLAALARALGVGTAHAPRAAADERVDAPSLRVGDG
jgi:succinoglycan biosynthesis protein ExoA